ARANSSGYAGGTWTGYRAASASAVPTLASGRDVKRSSDGRSRSVPAARCRCTTESARPLDRHYQASHYQADDDLVFGHPRPGRPLDSSNVRARFKDALDAAGVRPVRFHDLRHTFGTQMATAGVTMRTLQEWMGHRDIKTTISTPTTSRPIRNASWWSGRSMA